MTSTGAAKGMGSEVENPPRTNQDRTAALPVIPIVQVDRFHLYGLDGMCPMVERVVDNQALTQTAFDSAPDLGVYSRRNVGKRGFLSYNAEVWHHKSCSAQLVS